MAEAPIAEPVEPSGESEGRSRRRKFVLVHGAWHGAWCWSRVTERLEAAGHDVLTPTLTGLAERSHLLSSEVGLATHIADVANLIRWEELSDVVLVGHSYAGWVISGVAEELEASINSIVFVDAFFPESGAAVLDDAPASMRQAITDAIASGEVGREPPPAAFFNVNDRDLAWVESKMTPMPIRTFTSAITLSGARDRIRNRTYVRATSHPFPLFDAVYKRLSSDPGWRTYEIPCGHDVMIDMPERLSEILIEVA
jgi:pimeloyl-ACP methyl ester carboxylesterase